MAIPIPKKYPVFSSILKYPLYIGIFRVLFRTSKIAVSPVLRDVLVFILHIKVKDCTIIPTYIKQYNKKNLNIVFFVKMIKNVIAKYINVQILNLLKARHNEIKIINSSINFLTNLITLSLILLTDSCCSLSFDFFIISINFII